MERQAIAGGWSTALVKAVVKAVVLVPVLFLGSCGSDDGGSTCGDNIVDAGEVCDDGNGTCGDGCSSRCELEMTMCSYDSDCGSEEYCGTGGFCNSCGMACDDNSDCLDVCTVDGVCAPIQCGVDADCAAPGVVCSNGRCFLLPPLLCENALPPDCADATCPAGQQCIVEPKAGICVCDVVSLCADVLPPHCAAATCPAGPQCVFGPGKKSCVCEVPPACEEAFPFDCAGAVCPGGQQCVLNPDKMCVCGDANGSAASSGHFVYGVNPNPSFSIGSDGAGQSPNHELTFDVTAGELETFRAVLIYPAAFGFNGFSTLGPANTQVGNYAFDFDFDGTPELTVPIRVLTDDVVYADLFPDAEFVSDYEPTIEHSGAHVFTVILPHGGDFDSNTITAPINLRVSVEFFAGILTNPLTPGLYTLTGDFTSVDPDTDGFDDGLNNSPLTFSAELDVNIDAPSCNGDCVWDVDFSGQVRVPDLIKLLSCWGPLTGDLVCACLDIDSSGDVRVPDLIALLAKWGVCP